MTFQEQIELYLAPLPSEWKEKLTAILCEINSSQQTINCQDVKNCETLTSLSAFTINGSEITISYKDEKGITTPRTLDIEELVNSIIQLDPACLTDETTWSNLTLTERIQLLIDRQCECCGEDRAVPFINTAIGDACRYIAPVTPINPPDNDPFFQHYIKFIGQTGQGNEYVEIPLEEDEVGYFVPVSGNIIIPPMTGNYKIVFVMITGSDYPTIQIFNSSNTDIGGGVITSGNIPSNPSSTFNVANLDHITFDCQNSG